MRFFATRALTSRVADVIECERDRYGLRLSVAAAPSRPVDHDAHSHCSQRVCDYYCSSRLSAELIYARTHLRLIADYLYKRHSGVRPQTAALDTISVRRLPPAEPQQLRNSALAF